MRHVRSPAMEDLGGMVVVARSRPKQKGQRGRRGGGMARGMAGQGEGRSTMAGSLTKARDQPSIADDWRKQDADRARVVSHGRGSAKARRQSSSDGKPWPGPAKAEV